MCSVHFSIFPHNDEKTMIQFRTALGNTYFPSRLHRYVVQTWKLDGKQLKTNLFKKTPNLKPNLNDLKTAGERQLHLN